jgi:hypothetical protein
LGINDRVKQGFVATFLTEPSLERCNMRILGRRPRTEEVQGAVVFGGPLGDGVTNKLRAISHREGQGAALRVRQPVEDVDDTLAGEGSIGRNRETLPTTEVFNGQKPSASPCGQTIDDNIHRPVLSDPGRSNEGRVTASPVGPLPIPAWQRYACFSIEPRAPFVIHPSAFPPQQTPQPPRAEAMARRR